MEIKVFGNSSCPVCKTALQKYEFFLKRWGLKEKIPVRFYNMDTLDGLVEGTMNEVVEVPTTLIIENGRVLARWEKKVVLSEELKPFFKKFEKEEKK